MKRLEFKKKMEIIEKQKGIEMAVKTIRDREQIVINKR
mgnify:CR=1 FL=1